MQAIGMRAMARCIVRFSRDRKACLYYAACVCLLVAAAGLRFHDLSGNSLWFDEAVAANNSSGALSEVVSNTRRRNSSPILYPLVLWAVQQVESTAFSVRIVPATASVLTVAVMLFLLPRLGVARGAAFLAALLATLSVEAIRHAQDAREYSIDALLAVLMLAGLLWYLRDGRKALLCVSLLLAPLLQYGLVLFGVAVIGAAAVVPRVSGQERRSAYLGRIGGWLKRRLDLVVPCGFFLGGGAVSYLMTLRYQWRKGGFGSDSYLSRNYYQGKFDAHSIFEFSIDGIWSLLTYHLTEAVAVAALAVFALLLVVAFLGKLQGKLQVSAIAVLFSFCIAISVGAAVLGIYPLGRIRQVIYLGPIVFLAAGVAFHWIAGSLPLLLRRAYLALASGFIVLGGVDAMKIDDPWREFENIHNILSVLEDEMQEGDVIYVTYSATPAMKFYNKTTNDYHYGRCLPQSSTLQACLEDIVHAVIPDGKFLDLERFLESNRLWIVNAHRWPPSWKLMEILGDEIRVENRVFNKSPHPSSAPSTLDLVTNFKQFSEPAVNIEEDNWLMIAPILSRKPSIRSTFDVYLSEDILIYVKEPCSAEDVQETFFVHVFPVSVDDLPARHKGHGFDIHDFRFTQHGVRSAERCVALRELPDYDFNEIHTGQYLVREDGSFARLWTREIRFDE